MHPIIPLSDIQINSTAYRFEGRNYGDIAASFFLVHTEPGNGPSLHTHPYEEVFIVQQGDVFCKLNVSRLYSDLGALRQTDDPWNQLQQRWTGTWNA